MRFGTEVSSMSFQSYWIDCFDISSHQLGCHNTRSFSSITTNNSMSSFWFVLARSIHPWDRLQACISCWSVLGLSHWGIDTVRVLSSARSETTSWFRISESLPRPFAKKWSTIFGRPIDLHWSRCHVNIGWLHVMEFTNKLIRPLNLYIAL